MGTRETPEEQYPFQPFSGWIYDTAEAQMEFRLETGFSLTDML